MKIKGFTLIELLVVVAILIVLVAIAFFAYNKFIKILTKKTNDQKKRTAKKETLFQILALLEAEQDLVQM